MSEDFKEWYTALDTKKRADLHKLLAEFINENIPFKCGGGVRDTPPNEGTWQDISLYSDEKTTYQRGKSKLDLREDNNFKGT